MSIGSIIVLVSIPWTFLAALTWVMSLGMNEVFLEFDKKWHQWFLVFYVIKKGCEEDINLAGQIILQILGHIWFLPIVVFGLIVMMLAHLAYGVAWVFKRIFRRRKI